MNYETHIDTVALQIDCSDITMQQRVLNDLLMNIKSLGIYMASNNVLENKATDIVKVEYALYAYRSKICTINTGSFRTVDGGYYVIKYYISLKFAGLKSYNVMADKQSYDVLMHVCAYLNTQQIAFKITELDIALDAKVSFDHMLSICTKKSPKTSYWKIGEPQRFEDQTTYIEKIDQRNLGQARIRSYLYDKSLKERLPYKVTRFEIKLQSSFFHQYGLNINPIQNALNRYHIMYFEDIGLKNSTIDAYNNYHKPQRREIRRLQIDKYRLYPDIEYVEAFIRRLLNVYYYADFGVMYIPSVPC